MRTILALTIGYLIGARAGSKDVDQIVGSVKALRESEEFSDLVAAVRTHAGHTLRELATIVDTGGSSLLHVSDTGESANLVDGVRELFAQG